MTETATAALHDRMVLAASDARTAPRLAMVAATVLLLARGDDRDVAAVWMDFGGEGLHISDPPAGVDPDIRVWLDPELVEKFPFFHFSMAMADGRMTCEGPVKELLAVNPVLRTAVENGRLLARRDA